MVYMGENFYEVIYMNKYAKSAYFGHTPNGEEISKDMVERFYQYADQDILPYTRLAKELGEAFIDEDSFDYLLTGTAYGAAVKYVIQLRTNSDRIDLYQFMRRDYNRTFADLRSDDVYVDLSFAIYAKNDGIEHVYLEESDVYVNGTISTYDTDRFAEAFDIEKLCEFVERLAIPAAREIHAELSNI